MAASLLFSKGDNPTKVPTTWNYGTLKISNVRVNGQFANITTITTSSQLLPSQENIRDMPSNYANPSELFQETFSSTSCLPPKHLLEVPKSTNQNLSSTGSYYRNPKWRTNSIVTFAHFTFKKVRVYQDSSVTNTKCFGNIYSMLR